MIPGKVNLNYERVLYNITLKAHWTPTAASTAITTATIENVKFNYQPGDAPQATAWISESDTDKYEIAYECWQQFENNNPVAAWYSDNGSHGALPTITDLAMTPQSSDATPEYKFTEGANSSWTQNSDGTLKFVVNGDFSKFTGIKIDGTLIAADKYTAVSGSTIITLKKDYLDTLSFGKHTLTVVYNEGECSTEFDIKAAQSKGNTESPKTGDNSSLMLWIALLFVSGGTVIGTTVASRKKKNNG